MLRFVKADRNNDFRDGTQGYDLTANKCPECGGYPIIVDFIDRKCKMPPVAKNSQYKKVAERRTYYHCQCNACVTDWCKPKYGYDPNKGLIVISDSHAAAHEAWQKRRWIKIDKNKLRIDK